MDVPLDIWAGGGGGGLEKYLKKFVATKNRKKEFC